jgi:DNA-binding transcriptional regulator YdaS (Cro superfamily)
MKKLPIQDIINIVGGQKELATMIGVSQQTISHWKVNDFDIPAEMVVALEKATRGEIPRWQVRPDLWEPSARR